ncbi:hypothetical protein UFOVP678_50 [uncultured Caudovirales phage]|uniref:Uncharacterized protein n=1 Tax=uncultured Caudovirales phage TaxID=2100421 RepID=A0A6J5NK44_9CAUD|nr:hypothetical protein UFOVP678_50 [uncultured Caudovirales phage]
MSNYTKATDFASKDSLSSGNPLKIVRGAEINTEFAAIQTAVNSKADLASPTFTGTLTAVTLAVTGNETVGGTLTVTGALEAASLDGGTF